MNSISNMSNFFFNIFSFRGDSEIKNYFSAPYNNAILSLMKEGLDIKEEFVRLCDSYKKSYSLNKQESDFINEIETKFNIKNNRFLIENNNLHIWELSIDLALNFIKSFKDTINLLDYKYKNDLLIIQCKLLKVEIEKMKPAYEAIILRKSAKIILEKLFTKYIDSINLDNYSPEIENLKYYLNSLKMYYMPNKFLSKNIQNEIAELILKEEKCVKLQNENKKKPKIIFNINDNQIEKIIKILFKINSYCNEIIYPSFDTINFDINDYINADEDDDDDEKMEKYEEDYDINASNIINFNCKNTIKNPKKISISKILEFMAFGKGPQATLNKVIYLENEINEKIPIIYDEIEDINNKEQNVDYFLKKIKPINKAIKNKINELILSDNNGLILDKVENISEYIKRNILSLSPIPIHISNGEKNEKNNIRILNSILNDMDIYRRLKFNLTFDYNISLLELNNKLNPVLENLNKISKIERQINDINFKNRIDEIKNEMQNYDKKIRLFKRQKLFVEINEIEFVEEIVKIFGKEGFIDFSTKEISNFYMFIYLKKNNLYHEKSFKMATDIK